MLGKCLQGSNLDEGILMHNCQLVGSGNVNVESHTTNGHASSFEMPIASKEVRLAE